MCTRRFRADTGNTRVRPPAAAGIGTDGPGTWIPLDAGEQLAEKHSVVERLRPIFDYVPGNESPPPAPRHASKPKAPRKPAVPKWNSKVAREARESLQVLRRADGPSHEFDNGDVVMGDDTPDNVTVASASYIADEDRFDISHVSGGRNNKRRKAEMDLQDITQQQHGVYGDELLDYFLLTRAEAAAQRPEPPPNFQPDWVIDSETHTALHWASAMGDVDVIRQLKRFGSTLNVQNIRGETPLMRSVNFTNCFEKQTFPNVLKELFETVGERDSTGSTVIHHAAIMKHGRVTSHTCSRYYLENILNKLTETQDPQFAQSIIDAQDMDGNTALHLAAQINARKCVRSLLGRNASTHIRNAEGTSAEDLIKDLNAVSKRERVATKSSSPFAPESSRHDAFKDVAFLADGKTSRKLGLSFQSAAANTVQSRIMPLIFEKIQDLAQSYDQEWSDKEAAEKEARHFLANTNSELTALRHQTIDVESQLEPDDVADKVNSEANHLKHQVLSIITHQNRISVQQAVDKELTLANGDVGADDDATSAAEHLHLARQLNDMLREQRQAEAEYVEALSMVGTGDKIEKYRRLLRKCLDPREGETLDTNLDSLIDMMEEERESGAPGVMEMAAAMAAPGTGEMDLVGM